MNKLFKILSLFLIPVIVAVCIMSVHAVSLYTDGDYTYADVDEDHVALYDYTGHSNVLIVPDYFSGKIVSEIYSYSFENNVSITSIDFSVNPNYITNIGTKAFAECTGLTGSLSLPSSLRALGYAAFQGCTGLETLTINVGMRTIPEQCFNRCSGLREVYLPTNLESIERLAFGNCSYLETVYVPSTVTSINDYAFTNSRPTLYVYNNSYAHQFAIDHKISYELIDPPTPTEAPEPTETPTEAPTESPTEAPTELKPTEVPTEATPTENPTIPATESSTEVSVNYLGDVDEDGKITAIDTTLIQRYLSYISFDLEKKELADVDKDEIITIIDVTYIMRHLAKMDTPYPIGKPI